MTGTLLFDLAAVATLFGAVLVLVLPNPLRAAMALILSLGGLAACYLLLHAEFVAVMQLLVYAGAIMVLFVFVIMLLNLEHTADPRRGLLLAVVVATAIAGAALACARALGARTLSFGHAGESPNVVRALASDFGSVEQVGGLVLTDLVLPFELLSLLLLVAILGAVVVAKKRL